MGTSLLRGLLNRSAAAPGARNLHISACVKSPQSIERLREALGLQANEVDLDHGSEALVRMAGQAQVVVLGCTPGDLPAMLDTPGFASVLDKQLVISMLAGKSMYELREELVTRKISDQLSIMRVTPTIGAQNNGAVCLVAENSGVEQESVKLVHETFNHVGTVIQLPEKFLNHAVAIGATCHALSLVAVDAITDASVAEGIPRPLAVQLAQQSMASALSVMTAGMSVEQMKEALSTPSGITINSVLQCEHGVRSGIVDNVRQAIKYANAM